MGKMAKIDGGIEVSPWTLLGYCAWCGTLTDVQSGCVIVFDDKKQKLQSKCAFSCEHDRNQSSEPDIIHTGNPVFENKAVWVAWAKRHPQGAKEILMDGGPKFFCEKNKTQRGRTSKGFK